MYPYRGIWKIGERGNIKGTATLKVAEYTEKTRRLAKHQQNGA